MTTPRRWVAVLATALFALGLGTAPASAGGVPELKIDRDRAAAGEKVTVSVSGWPAGAIQISVCGNRADDPATDCDAGSAVGATVDTSGRGTATVTVAVPPVGCPCAILAVGPTEDFTAYVPFTVTDAAVLPGFEEPDHATHALTVTRSALTGGSLGSLFGGGVERTLVLVVRNTGSAPVTDLALTVAAGRGSSPTGVIAAPAIDAMAVGEERTLRIPVTLDGPAFGTYTVHGEVYGLDGPLTFDAHTASYPWGLLAVPVVALALWRRKQVARLIRRPSRAGVAEPS